MLTSYSLSFLLLLSFFPCFFCFLPALYHLKQGGTQTGELIAVFSTKRCKWLLSYNFWYLWKSSSCTLKIEASISLRRPLCLHSRSGKHRSIPTRLLRQVTALLLKSDDAPAQFPNLHQKQMTMWFSNYLLNTFTWQKFIQINLPAFQTLIFRMSYIWLFGYDTFLYRN